MSLTSLQPVSYTHLDVYKRQASKTATIDPISIATPGNGGTSFSNEVNFFFTGDSGAVRQAIIGAREVGKQLLKALEPNEPLESGTVPYI